MRGCNEKNTRAFPDSPPLKNQLIFGSIGFSDFTRHGSHYLSSLLCIFTGHTRQSTPPPKGPKPRFPLVCRRGVTREEEECKSHQLPFRTPLLLRLHCVRVFCLIFLRAGPQSAAEAVPLRHRQHHHQPLGGRLRYGWPGPPHRPRLASLRADLSFLVSKNLFFVENTNFLNDALTFLVCDIFCLLVSYFSKSTRHISTTSLSWAI